MILDNELYAAANRFQFICSNVPKCESCGHKQVQVIYWSHAPAVWKCRICKHEFIHEPVAGQKI